MPEANRELYPTTRINVPNFVPLMERLRDESLKRAITIVHVHSPEEGEWIFNTAAARLHRDKIPIVGPEAGRVIDIVETAIRTKSPIAFTGEMRRDDDSRALRAGATFGIHTLAFVVRETRKEADDLVTMLGSWSSFDLALLSEIP